MAISLFDASVRNRWTGTNNLHHPATTFTAQHRAWLRWGEYDTFAQLHQWDQFAVGVQKAEVAGAAVTFGQDMLQDQAQECHAAERAG